MLVQGKIMAKNQKKSSRVTRQSKKQVKKSKNTLSSVFLRLFRVRRNILILFAVLFAAVGSYYLLQTNAAAATYYVSPTGSDSNPGTQAAPWKTIKKSITSLQPGDTLIVGGGTYTERVKGSTGSLHLPRGTSSLPITVKAATGEKPVIKGVLWVRYVDYWTWDGVGVMWDDQTGTASEHMVKIHESNYFRLTNSEIWGARSYAGLLIGNDTKNFTIDRNYFHDTYPSNDLNQDHLIYIGGLNSGPGLIEKNIFKNSPNGRGIKIGHGSGDTSPMGYATIRYNTFYDNQGPSNIQLSYGATGSKIYRNIMQKSSSHNITTFNLAGTGNEAWENIGWESRGVVDVDNGLLDKGGNVYRDPRFTDIAASNFMPLDDFSKAYGRYALESGDDTPEPPAPPPVDNTDTQAPTAPANLRTLEVKQRSLTITWDESTDNVGVISYKIYRSGSSTPVATVSELRFTDASLKPNRNYTYKVIAVDAAGNKSAVSNELKVRTSK